MSMQHPTYTPAQLRAFWAHIGLPPAWRHASLSSLPSQTPAAHLAFLEIIMRYALVTIPFENMTLHYSMHKAIALDHEVLFGKVVGGLDAEGAVADGVEVAAVAPEGNGVVVKRKKNCRGGYCMENNLLLATVLRTVGFKVRSCGGRVWDHGWTAWGHMVNLVIIGGTKYVVDIGFGNFGPVRPLPLPDKQSSIPEDKREWPAHSHIAPASTRYVWRNPGRLAENGQVRPTTAETADDDEDEGMKLWVYEARTSDNGAWTPTYGFAELEFYPRDYGAMNWSTSKNPTSFFTYLIMVVRFVFRSEVKELCRRAGDECGQGEEVVGVPYQDDSWDGAGDEIVGKLIMLGEVKLKIHDQSCLVQRKFETESERTDALARWFSVRLTDAEKRGIRGMVSQIKDKKPE